MREAFFYMFKDNKYINKAMVYFIFALCANFCAIYAQTFFTSCKGVECSPNTSLVGYIWYFAWMLIALVPFGYQMSCVKALISQQENYVLPNINFLKNFAQGFRLSFSIVFAVATVFVSVVLVLRLIAVISGIFVANNTVGVVVLISVILLTVFLIIAGIILSNVLTWVFADTNNLTSFLRIPTAIKLIKANSSIYWVALGLSVLVGLAVEIFSFIISLVVSLSVLKIVASLVGALVSALIASYTTFVTAFLVAKSIKKLVSEEV